MLSSGGEFKMVWGGTGNSSSSIMGSLRLPPCAEEQDAASSPASMLFLPQQLLHISSSSSSPSLNIPEVNCSTGLHPLGSFHGDVQQESGMPDQSWRQLLLGGLVGDHEKYSTATALLSKGLDDEGSLLHEASAAAYDFYGNGAAAAAAAAGEEIQASPEATSCRSQLSQMLLQAASSPRSCVTTSGLGSSMMEFSNSAAAPAPAPELTRKHHGQSDNSSECNSTETGSALKKARVQASSSAQSTLKVRKERLGDRITALHQIVSPFGKTDTASVLQETIGYIRFLMSQIEALSYPYLGQCCSANPMQQQTGIMAGERSTDGLLPEFPDQLDVEKDGNKQQAKKDLRSRGLCLVPVSCMPHLAADNDVVVGSDFWAAAGGGGGGGAPPLAGMNLR